MVLRQHAGCLIQTMVARRAFIPTNEEVFQRSRRENFVEQSNCDHFFMHYYNYWLVLAVLGGFWGRLGGFSVSTPWQPWLRRPQDVGVRTGDSGRLTQGHSPSLTMATPPRLSQHLHSQAKEIIFYGCEYLEQEKQNGGPFEPLSRVNRRAGWCGNEACYLIIIIIMYLHYNG